MLDDKARTLAEGPTLAVVTTLLPDGTPMTQPLWVDTDGENIILNTEIGRQKMHNSRRDPRVTVTLVDPENDYSYAEVRGKVVETITGPEAREHIDALSRKYTGHDYANPIGTERVILKIAPDRVYIRA